VRPAGLGERLVGPLQGSPACRCRSTTRPSSGRTSSGPSPRARGTPPRWTSARPGSSSRGAPAGHRDGSAARPPACPTGPASSRRRPARGASSPSGRRRPSPGRPCRCRRRPPGPRDARPPRGRGCSSASAGRPPAPSRGSCARCPGGARIVLPAIASSTSEGRRGRRRRLSYAGRREHSSPPGRWAAEGVAVRQARAHLRKGVGASSNDPAGLNPRGRKHEKPAGLGSGSAHRSSTSAWCCSGWSSSGTCSRRPATLRVPYSEFKQAVREGPVQARAGRPRRGPGLHHRRRGAPSAQQRPIDRPVDGQPRGGPGAGSPPGVEEDPVRGHRRQRARGVLLESGGCRCSSASSSGCG
jgi:hypothetical protein